MKFIECRSKDHWENLMIFRHCWHCGLGDPTPVEQALADHDHKGESCQCSDITNQ